MHRRNCLTLLLASLCIAVTGCQFLSFATYMFGPPRVRKAEFRLGKGPLAIFIESAQADGSMPIFERELHVKLDEILRAERISNNVVPRNRAQSLPQRHPDFRSWSLQKIGRTLGADQLLYVRIQELRVREAPDHPLLSPMVRLELKVIDVNAPPSRARAWPEYGARKLPPITRQPEEASTRERTDMVIVKLARDAAQEVAKPFYDVDLEQPSRREP